MPSLEEQILLLNKKPQSIKFKMRLWPLVKTIRLCQIWIKFLNIYFHTASRVPYKSSMHGNKDSFKEPERKSSCSSRLDTTGWCKLKPFMPNSVFPGGYVHTQYEYLYCFEVKILLTSNTWSRPSSDQLSTFGWEGWKSLNINWADNIILTS